MPDDLIGFGWNEIAYGEPRPLGAAFLPIKANHSAKSNLNVSIKLSNDTLKK